MSNEVRVSMREVIKQKYGETEKTIKHSRSTKRQENNEKKVAKKTMDGYERTTRIVDGVKYSTLK